MTTSAVRLTVIVCLGVLCLQARPAPGDPPVKVQVKTAGQTENGQKIDQFTMSNANGMKVTVITYGATITGVMVPDRDGKVQNVTLHLDSVEDYLKGHPLFGSIVGRYANRISNASFDIDGTRYPITPNVAGKHHIHGGRVGFQKIVWQAKPIRQEGQAGVELTHTSPDGNEGYPGTLSVKLQYVLTSDNRLVLEYWATTDKPTHVNLTNHAYWNLAGAGSGTVLDHVVTIHADKYVVANRQRFPSGELRSVDGTPLDFRTPHTIGQRINELEIKNYDDCYVLNKQPGNQRALAARVVEKKSGRVMEVYTTAPGVQFYTAKGLSDRYSAGGVPYGPYHGFCLETQHFPDSPNKRNFPSTLLRPGQIYHQKTVYQFGF